MNEKRTTIIYVSICFIILLFFLDRELNSPNKEIPTPAYSSEKNNDKIEVDAQGKTIFLDKAEWSPMQNTQEWAKNFQSKYKKGAQQFETVLTIFLQPMTPERKIGKMISQDEYVEMFSSFPKTVTVQLRVNKGDYWILKRDTYKVATINPTKVETDPNVYQQIYRELQVNIDDSRFFVRTKL